MLAHYFEHFQNSILRWDAIVCWVGAHSSEISMFFCHLAELVGSNVNVTIVILCCWKKKKRKASAPAYMNFSWGNAVSASKVVLYLQQCNRGQNLSQELHRAKCQEPAAPSRWELQNLNTCLDFSQILTRWLFIQKYREIIFTIK